MTEVSFPFTTGAGAGVPTQQRWSDMLRGFPPHGDGVWKTTDALYDLLRCQVYADSTGMRVKRRSGRATIWGFHYVDDAEKILTIDAAHATLGRIDRVVLELDTTLADNQIVAKVVPGTAAASPVATTLVATATLKQVSLATVLVDAAVSTIAAGKVTDTRPFLLSGFVPAAILLRAANQTIPHNTLTQLTFTTISRDTDAAAGSGGYSAKTAGWYDLSAAVQWSAAQLTGTRRLDLAVNRAAGGSSNLIQDERQANGGAATAQAVATQEYLNIGDSVQVNVYHTNGATAALDVAGVSPQSPRLTAAWRGP